MLTVMFHLSFSYFMIMANGDNFAREESSSYSLNVLKLMSITGDDKSEDKAKTSSASLERGSALEWDPRRRRRRQLLEHARA